MAYNRPEEYGGGRILRPGIAALALFLACPPALGAAPALDWNVTFTRTFNGDEKVEAACFDGAGNTHTVFLDNLAFQRWLVQDSTGAITSSVYLDPVWEPYEVSLTSAALAGTDLVLGGVRVNQVTGKIELTVARFAPTGARVWASTYDTGYDNTSGGIAVSAAGDVFIAGYYNDGAADTGVVAKFDSTGAYQWARVLTGGVEQQAFAVVANGTEAVVVARDVPAMAGRTRLVRFDAAGSVLQDVSIAVTTDDYPRAAVYVAALNMIYVAVDNFSTVAVLRVNPVTLASAGTGSRPAPTEINIVGGIAVDAAGSVCVAGLTWNLMGGNYNVGLYRFTVGLLPSWVSTYDGGGWDALALPVAAARVGFDAVGNAYVAAAVTPSACLLDAQDVFLRKVSSGGVPLWTKTLDSAPVNLLNGVATDAAGDAYVGAIEAYDPLLVKYSAAGAFQWSREPSWAGRCAYAEGGGGVAAGGGSVFLAATVLDTMTYASEARVARYSTAGTLTATYVFNLIPDVVAGPLAADAAGNVYLAGSFFSSTTLEYEIYVAKFNAAGVIVWTRTGSFGVNDDPAEIVLDGAGALYMSIPWPADGVTYDRYGLIKMNTADGSVAWANTYGTSPTLKGEGFGLATFGGDVYLAGEDEDPVIPASWGRLWRIDGSGGVVWSVTFGGGGQDSGFSDVSADPSGHLDLSGRVGSWPLQSSDVLAHSCYPSGTPRWDITYDSGGRYDEGDWVTSVPGAAFVAGSSGKALRLMHIAEPASAGLVASLAVTPALARVGEWIEVVLTVTNQGTADADAMVPAIELNWGALDANLETGPVPPGPLLIAAGTSQAFTWTYSMSGTVEAGFTATVTGVDLGLSVPVDAWAAGVVNFCVPCSYTLTVTGRDAEPIYVPAAGQQLWRLNYAAPVARPLFSATITTDPGSFAERTYVAPSMSVTLTGGGAVAGSWATDLAGPWTAGEPPDGTGEPLYLRWVLANVPPGAAGAIGYRTAALPGPEQLFGFSVSGTVSCDAASSDAGALPFSVTGVGKRIAPPLMALRLADGSGAGPDRGYAVAIGPAGEVVVAGSEWGATGANNWIVRRYDASLTALPASTVYAGPGGTTDVALGVAVAGNGDIIVVGTEWTPTGSFDWRITRYNPALSAVVASTVYAGPGNWEDIAYGVALDGSGNVIVAGSESKTMGGDSNLVVRKYNATLSALLAATTYEGGAGGDDRGLSVAADASGNVLVAGLEFSPAGSFDWVVRKYNAGLSVLLASAGYDGPANWTDVAYAIAVDVTGNVLVAGMETGIAGGDNWAVRKYDSNLDLIWSRAYDSPAGGADEARGLAVDRSGSLVVAGFETRTDLGQGTNWRILKLDNGGNSIDSAGHDGLVSGDDSLFAAAMSGTTCVVAGAETALRGGEDVAVALYDLAAFDAPHPAAGLSALASGPAIGLAWLPAAAGTRPVSGYSVYRTTYSGVAVALDNWYADVYGATASVFVDTGVTNGVTYRYKVIPVDDLMASATSSITASAQLGAAFLTGALTVVPDQAVPTQTVDVRFRVRNTGLAPASVVMPELEINTFALSVTLYAPPAPPGPVTIAPGASRTFIWSYTVTGYGLVTWTATATGIDDGLGGALFAADSATLLVAPIASLDAALAISPPSATILVGQWITVQLTVTNTGGLEAYNLSATVIYGPPGALVLQSGPVASLDLAVGSSTVLTWTYSVSGGGVMRLTATLTGDNGAGGPVSNGGSGIRILARPGALAANIAILPDAVPSGGMITVRVTVTNTGDMPVTGVLVDPVPLTAIFTGSATLTLASGPVPTGPLTLVGQAATAFSWTYSTAGQGYTLIETFVYGTDSGYGTGLSATVFWISCDVPRGGLTASLSATPLVVSEGGKILVTMTVSNSGATPIWSATPTAGLVMSSTSFAVQAAGPNPKSMAFVGPCPVMFCQVDETGCPPVTFTWTVTALSEGTVSFSASVWWTESAFMTVSVTGALSNTVFIQAGARLAASASAVPAALKYGQPFEFRLSVTNTGSATVWNLRPALTLSDPRLARVDLAPSALGSTLANGAPAIWVWELTALEGGALTLTGGLTGIYDALSGTVMTTVPAGATAPASITISARPEGEIAVYPNPAAGDRVTIYVHLAADASEVVVDAYDASMHRVFTGTWRNVPWLDGNMTLTGLNTWAPGIYLIRARATLVNGVTRVYPVTKLKVRR